MQLQEGGSWKISDDSVRVWGIWGWHGETFPDVLNTWCRNCFFKGFDVASCMNMLQHFTPRHLPLWNSWFLCWYRLLKHNYIRILMHNLSLDPNAGEPFWAASYNGLVEWVRRPSNELSVLRRLRKRNQKFVEVGRVLLIKSCTSSLVYWQLYSAFCPWMLGICRTMKQGNRRNARWWLKILIQIRRSWILWPEGFGIALWQKHPETFGNGTVTVHTVFKILKIQSHSGWLKTSSRIVEAVL